MDVIYSVSVVGLEEGAPSAETVGANVTLFSPLAWERTWPNSPISSLNLLSPSIGDCLSISKSPCSAIKW